MPVIGVGPRCEMPGCRSAAQSNGICIPHELLARAVGRRVDPDMTALDREFAELVAEPKKRCTAFLSDDGMTMHLLLHHGRPFDPVDVNLVVEALQARRRG